MNGTQSNAQRGGRLDTTDMERRIVEFRLSLDREMRRCKQARMMDVFEKLLRDKLGESCAPEDEQRAQNAIKLDRLDTEGLNKLTNFLEATISLCREPKQRGMFEKILRDVLVASRMVSGGGPPMCVVCGSSLSLASGLEHHHATGHHHHACDHNGRPMEAADHIETPPALQFQNGNHLNGTGHANGPNSNNNANGDDYGSAFRQTYTPNQEARVEVATPPPSAAPTPDVLEQLQNSPHNSSLQRLKNQFNRSFTSRMSFSAAATTTTTTTVVPAPTANGNEASVPNGSGAQTTNGDQAAAVAPPAASTTPPLSPNIAAAILLQQQQQSQAALSAAASASNSQQVNSTTSQQQQQQPAAMSYQPFAPTSHSNASSNDNQQQQQQQQQQRQQQPTTAPQFVADSADEDSIYGEQGPDSVRAAIEQLDRVCESLPAETIAALASRSQPNRSSTPLSVSPEEQPSSDLVIDEEANLSQSRLMSPIKPPGAEQNVKNNALKGKLKGQQASKASSSSAAANMIRHNLNQSGPQSRFKQRVVDVISAANGPSAGNHANGAGARHAARMRASSPPPQADSSRRIAPSPAIAVVASTSSAPIEVVAGPTSTRASRSQSVNQTQPQPQQSAMSQRIEEAARRQKRGNRTKTTRRKSSSQMA